MNGKNDRKLEEANYRQLIALEEIDVARDIMDVTFENTNDKDAE